MSDKEVLNEIHDVLNQISEALVEIRAWYRQTPQSEVKSVLENILEKPRQIAAYNLSDGEVTTRYLSQKTGAATGTVSRWWNEWINRGIAIPIKKGPGYRARKLFNVKDYGIIVPDLKSLTNTKEDSEQ